MSAAQIPMTIIGGFLGAGKTTLLNRVLGEAHGVRYGVLVNDFGALAIDETLVTSHDGETIAFANGCVCCSLGDNLAFTIERLANAANPPEQFLVEASGVANPRAIADMATLHPNLKRDMVVVLVDADSILNRAVDPRLSDTVTMQLSHADLVVMNKCDVASDVEAVREFIRTTVDCPIVSAVNADIELSLLHAGIAGHSSLDSAKFVAMDNTRHDPGALFESKIQSMPVPVDVERLRTNLTDAGLLRAKGFVRNAANDELLLVEVVGQRVAITPWSGDANVELALVTIALKAD